MSTTLSKRIRTARERNGLTQTELAEMIGVTAAAISNWEAGTEPSGANKDKLRELLNELPGKEPQQTSGELSSRPRDTRAPSDSTALGQRIRRAREREGLTQVALADKVGVTASAISNWEAGTEPRGVNRDKLEAILGRLSKKGTSEARDNREDSAPSIPPSEISSFGIWVRDQRIKAPMSVPELARAAGISVVALYNIESGKIQNPQALTRDKLAKALSQVVPRDVVAETESEQEITGLGNLTDFDPHDKTDWPQCSGIYVLYDVSQRPIYVGKAEKISSRLHRHINLFWYRDPIVRYGSYIEVTDKMLRHQLEQAMIKFLKSNAVVNKQSSENFDEE